VSPIVMPVNVGDSLMRRVRASAIIRKARGEWASLGYAAIDREGLAHCAVDF
jgi:hypothetical protein